ncbi:hypothetical protein [Hyphomicrobium sp.]
MKHSLHNTNWNTARWNSRAFEHWGAQQPATQLGFEIAPQQ